MTTPQNHNGIGVFFDLPGFSLLRSPQQHPNGGSDRSLTSLSLSPPPPSSSSSLASRGERERPRHREMDRNFMSNSRVMEDTEEWEDVRGAFNDQLLDLQYPWFCSACTMRNSAERMSCEACGKGNRHREKLRGMKEAETKAQLKQNLQEQEGLLDSFRDLEDLEEEEEVIIMEQIIVIDEEDEEKGGAEESSRSGQRKKQQQHEADGEGEMLSSSSITSLPAPPLVLMHSQSLKEGQSPIRSCPSELLLSCISYLGNPSVYSQLREVSKGWVRLVEHEMLWKPLASLHCRPKEKKTTSTMMMTTPVASQQKASSQSTACAVADSQTKKVGTTPASAGKGEGACQVQAPPERWSCKACGLIQADPYGLECEFCSAQREIITSPPPTGGAVVITAQAKGEEEESPPMSCFRVIGSYNELAQIWAAQRDTTALPEEKPLYSQERKRKADAALEAEAASIGGPSAGIDGLVHMAGQGTEFAYQAAEATGDYYYLYKAYHIDRALAGEWDTLHRGWEWLVEATRKGLRTRLSCNREQINARDDTCIPITESFQKVVNKLTKRNWVLLWECMKAEFCLQAEALRRDIIRHMVRLRIGEMGIVRAYRTFLEKVLHIWEVYQAWVFEIDGFFGKLNDQVCGERYRATTSSFAACNINEANTPYVGEASLLAFRDHVLMHYTICVPLIRAAEGSDDSCSLATFFDFHHDNSHHLRPFACMEMQIGKVLPEDMEMDKAVVNSMEEAAAAATSASASAEGERSNSSIITIRTANYRRGSLRIIENVADLIERVTKMAEEMDVPEDSNSTLHHGEAYRRLVLRPLRATMAELRVDGKVSENANQVVELLRGEPRMMMVDEVGASITRGRWGGRKRDGKGVFNGSRGGGGGLKRARS